MMRPQSFACLLEFMPIGPPPLYICLCHEQLRELGVKTGEETHFFPLADELLKVVESAHPSVGERPVLRAYLESNRGKLVALSQDAYPYLYRFVDNK